MGTTMETDLPSDMLAVQKLEETAKFLDLEPWIVRRLRQSKREVTVSMELIRDDGEPMMYRGVRVQHSSARGPYMGPLMFSKKMSPGEALAKAMELTWQSALWELPFGGSVGWIGASLEELSEREARLLTRDYVESVRDVLSHDVLTPERGGHPEVNAWALSALGTAKRESLSAVTGKALSLGGVGREKIAAVFLRALAAESLRQIGMKLAGAQIAVTGFEQEARWLASALDGAGARVVAVSDRSGAVFHRSRLEVPNLLEYVQQEDVVFGFPNAQSMSAEEMMQLPCDLLVLATGQELRVQTKARVVVEAGGKIHSQQRKESLEVPALMADAGLRIADFLEWRKSACGVLADTEELRGLHGLVRKTWAAIWDYSNKYEFKLEQAAMAIAVGKVAQAIRMG